MTSDTEKRCKNCRHCEKFQDGIGQCYATMTVVRTEMLADFVYTETPACEYFKPWPSVNRLSAGLGKDSTNRPKA